jgi:hypothetical protein
MRMRYFVIGEDGQLYGPADAATLNHWITEGRLAATSMIMEELGGARFAASMLKELNFPSSLPKGLSRQGAFPGEDEVKTAWIMGWMGLLCCGFFGPIGLVYGLLGKKKGHPRAMAPVVFCTVVTLVLIAWAAYYISTGGLQAIFDKLR